MATLWRAIITAQIGNLEKPPEASLPIANHGFRRPVTGPKEVARVRGGAGRNVSEGLRYIRGEEHRQGCRFWHDIETIRRVHLAGAVPR